MPPAETSFPQAVFDVVDVGLVVLDEHARVTGWSGWMASASGRSASDVLGRRLDEIFPTLTNPRLSDAIAGSLNFGASSVLTHSLHPALLPLATRSGRPL